MMCPLTHQPDEARVLVDFNEKQKCQMRMVAFLLWASRPRNTPQWGAADAEIKVPSDENTDLKGSRFKA